MDIDTYLRNTLGLINQYGIAVQGVGGDESNPQFQYSVGLAAHDHPEFIVHGLPMQIGQTIINDISRIVLDQKATFAAGDEITNLVHSFPVVLVEVSDTTEHLTISNRIYGLNGPVRALQIVFPDRDGRWPWSEGSGMSALPVSGTVPSEWRARDLAAYR